MDTLADYGTSSSDDEDASTFEEMPAANGTAKVSDLLQRLPPPSKTKQAAGQKRKLPISIPTDDDERPRDWEKQLAEQVAQEKPKQVGKKRIFAFGSLTRPTQIDEPVDEEEEETAPSAQSEVSTAQLGSASALLKMLPPPRAPSTSKSKVSTLIPHSVAHKPKINQPIVSSSQPTPAHPVDSDSDDDETATTDFFGFTSSKVDPQSVTSGAQSIPTLAPQARIYSDAPGPARPQFNESNEETGPMGAVLARKIGDEQAQRMIYEKELAPWGASDSLARSAVLNIREVSVDDQLGPNVHETLLRNLNNKVMAQVAAGGVPNVKKTPQDRMAKQKHQITHLARVAVAREETLLEQWANNKERKRESSKRYGF